MSKSDFTANERIGFDHWQEAARAGQRPQLEVTPDELLNSHLNAVTEERDHILGWRDGIACLAIKVEDPTRTAEEIRRYGTGRIIRCWARMTSEQVP